MSVDVTDVRVSNLEHSLESLLIVARERFRSWRENPQYEEQLLASFEVMREHALNLPSDIPLRLCELVLEARLLSDILIEAYKIGEFKGAILTGYGQEAVGAGVALTLHEDDWIARDHRSASAALARGASSLDFFLNHFMRSTGPTGGYDPNLHLCHLNNNDLGFLVSDMAMGASLINGSVSYGNLAKADEKGSPLDPEERIAGVSITGDGAASNGLFLAALNFAKARSLPVLEVILDNRISLGTSSLEQHGDIDLANRALGFEIPGITVDGDDALEVYLASYWLLDFARKANHPALLNAITFRRHGHNESESTTYVAELFEKEFLASVMSPDANPLNRIRKTCEELSLFDDENGYSRLLKSVRERVETAHQETLDAPDPVALREEMRGVFTDPDCSVSAQLAREHPASTSSRVITIKDALKEALSEEFTRDPLLQMLGEDIGFPKGGVFDVTSGLQEEFGGDRIFNSTLDESAIGGFVVGAVLAGGHAIAEYQFANFFFAAPSPILTVAATQTFMRELSIPIVLRAPTGYAPTSNHYHENLIEAFIAKALGIKVVVPSTPEDAKGLLKSAIRDPDPVFFLEEMSYYSLKGFVPEGEYFTPLGKAALRREGTDITLVTWGPKMLELALESAHELGARGIEVEVIDLRTLVPWDRETVFSSVKKTGRVIILYEDSKFMGFGAEISAAISEDPLFYSLKARVRRVAAMNIPIPAHPKLEDLRLPNSDDVMQVAHELMEES